MFDAEPEGWKHITLGEIISLEYGKALPEGLRLDGSVPVYGSNGPVGFHAESLVAERGIVIGRKGTAGSVHVTNGPFWPIDTTYFVRPRLEVDFDWLAATLRFADLGSLNESTGVPGLNRENAYRKPTLLPPFDEQRCIAEVLRSMDEAVVRCEKSVEGTTALWASLLDAHFHRADWEPTRPLPTGWTLTHLDAVAKRGSGHTPNKKIAAYWGGSIKWVSLQDTKRLDKVYISETSETITPEGIANSSAVLHPVGTVVLTRDATVGRSAITTSEMAVSQHLMAYVCGPKLNTLFLYYWLQRMKPIFERIGAGSTIKTIGLPFFKGLRIALPPMDEQIEIAAQMSEVDSLIASERIVLSRLKTVRAAISHDLLSGRVRVPA